MAIDVGPACNVYTANYPQAITRIVKDNPANATGTIDYICIYCGGVAMENVEVASFADEGSNVLSTNGVSGNLGTLLTDQQNIFNAPGDFTAFNINSDEYIGCYHSSSSGAIRGDQSGAGLWYKTGDQIPASSVTFTWAANYRVSIYATGTEVGVGLLIPVARRRGR